MHDGMFHQMNLLHPDHGIGRMRHRELIQDLENRETLRQARADQQDEHRQLRLFYRLYLLRHYLFRLVPRLAARMFL